MRPHLDHSGLVVADLESAGKQLHALGFNLSPLSQHTVPNPDGSLRLAGTANQCAMLQRGYIELVAVTDPAAKSFSNAEIGGFLGRFAGLHLLAIGTPDAGGVEKRLNSGTRPPVAMRDLHRLIATPDGPRDARFKLVVVPQLSGPDITFFFIEHQTPELLWTPLSLIHPNGAMSLLELVVVTEDLAAARPEFEKCFGLPAVSNGDHFTFALDKSRFLVMTADAAQNYYASPIPSRTLPHCAGQTVGVADLQTTKEILETHGVPFVHAGARLTVAPAHACGSFLQFVEEQQ